MNQSVAVIVIDGFRSEGVDVHGLAGDEVLDTSLDLRWTAHIVRTIVGSLSFHPHEGSPALRTNGDKPHGLCIRIAPSSVHADNLGDDLPTLFHIDIISDMKVESPDEILIVEGGSLHCCACQQHGLHVGHGSDGSRAPYLVRHLTQTGTGPFRLVFVGDGPTWALGGESQDALLAQRVHLEHDAIGGHGQVTPLGIPVADEVKDFLQGFHLPHPLTDFEPPFPGSLQILVMAVTGHRLPQHRVEVGIELAAGHEV